MNKNIFAMCALCMLGLGLSACSKEPQQANPPANDNTPQEMAPAETAKNGDDLIREPAPQVEAPAPQPTLAEIPMSKGAFRFTKRQGDWENFNRKSDSST